MHVRQRTIRVAGGRWLRDIADQRITQPRGAGVIGAGIGINSSSLRQRYYAIPRVWFCTADLRLPWTVGLCNARTMHKGETIWSGAPKTCPTCGATPELEVLRSAAGFYIGTQCRCGPYSRESLYYAIHSVAVAALCRGDWARREPPEEPSA